MVRKGLAKLEEIRTKRKKDKKSQCHIQLDFVIQRDPPGPPTQGTTSAPPSPAEESEEEVFRSCHTTSEESIEESGNTTTIAEEDLTKEHGAASSNNLGPMHGPWERTVQDARRERISLIASMQDLWRGQELLEAAADRDLEAERERVAQTRRASIERPATRCQFHCRTILETE